MPQTKRRAPTAAQGSEPAPPPFMGALLRLCWQRVRDHLQATIRESGFTDLQETHLAVFSYPLPEGVRPSDLARQIRMSRQATNYLIGQLEELGYLERRTAPEGERRLVYLTPRGWQVAEVIYGALRDLQAHWADEIGHERFAIFIGVLRTLTGEDPVSSNAHDTLDGTLNPNRRR